MKYLHNSLDWNELPDDGALLEARLRHRLRRADRYTSLCIAATDALLEGARPSPQTALITTSSFGPSETAFPTVEAILDVPAAEGPPTNFSPSVENAACSYLGVAFGFHGPVFALAGFDKASVASANRLAVTLLEQGLAPEALVLNVTCRSIVTDCAKTYYPERFPDGVQEHVRAWRYVKE